MVVPCSAAIAQASCRSHVRRGFYDFAKGGCAPIAAEALERIAALYRIEADIRGLNAAQSAVHTDKYHSAPLVSDLRAWFQAQHTKLFARGPTAEAIGYALNHWDGLVRFLDDGRIGIDPNTVERRMRPVTLSRKNALFDGAANWAAVASLSETCKLNAVDPQSYLAETITRLVSGWQPSRIDELMPWETKSKYQAA